MRLIDQMAVCVLRVCLKIYKIFVSPLLGQHCRFHPSCSVYFVRAVEHQGFIKGTFLGLKRIVRCNPWYTGQDESVLNENKG